MESSESRQVDTKDPENPPQYGSQPSANASSPPPAYGSWLDQHKDIRNTATTRQEYMKKSGEAFYNNESSLPMQLLFFPIPLSMAIVGGINWNNCPTQRLIPIWLVVAGGVFVALRVLSLIDIYIIKKKKQGTDDNQQNQSTFKGFTSIASIFLFAWFICGNVWVFGKYRPELDNRSDPNYCDRGTYLYSFSLIIITFISCFSVVAAVVVCGVLLSPTLQTSPMDKTNSLGWLYNPKGIIFATNY
uniref:Uncharacterized protein LOC100183982 n=1 Tax=Phallusia mammillata TaxID=59560 RepID=A0A6F9DIM3_9ASCI|nr:uncharacterized protein LOC100183982 [Phallusia mammillata]